MEKLIGIDSDYWNTFLGQDEGEDLYRDGSRCAVVASSFLCYSKLSARILCYSNFVSFLVI